MKSCMGLLGLDHTGGLLETTLFKASNLKLIAWAKQGLFGACPVLP